MDARRTTLVAFGTCLGVGLVLWLLFFVALEPQESSGCNTSLLDGFYKDALVPAHLFAALVLSAVLWRDDRWTRRGLAAVWLVIAICLAFPDVFGPIALVAVFAAPLLGIPALIALGISAALKPQWPRLAPMATVLTWGCLVLGLPASISYAWLEGANPFCF